MGAIFVNHTNAQKTVHLGLCKKIFLSGCIKTRDESKMYVSESKCKQQSVLCSITSQIQEDFALNKFFILRHEHEITFSTIPDSRRTGGCIQIYVLELSQCKGKMFLENRFKLLPKYISSWRETNICLNQNYKVF